MKDYIPIKNPVTIYEDYQVGDVISQYRIGNILYQNIYIGGNSWVMIPKILELLTNNKPI